MPLSNLEALSDEFSAIVAEAEKRIVAVGDSEGGWVSGIVWRTGLVVAAHEALGGETELALTMPDGTTATGTLAGRDPSTDVALVRVETPDFAEWPVADAVKVGALAFVVGRGETSALATFGLVGEAGPAWRSMRGGQIDARITLALRLPSRAEGSAVVDARGKLVGMAVTGVGRRAIAIPASTIARAVKTLSEKGYIPRSYLGISLHPLADGMGAIVVGIADDSPGATAGLAIGDVITTWDGTPVAGVRDLLNRLAAAAVGQTARIGVLRGGNAIDLPVVIGERPRG